jgi:hypothetical protein
VTSLKATWTFPDRKWDLLRHDNARPHTAQCSVDCIDRLSRPPSSPDLAPSDLCLFGTLKRQLAECHGTIKEELFRNAADIFELISEEELV